jgi:hypothetical protein
MLWNNVNKSLLRIMSPLTAFDKNSGKFHVISSKTSSSSVSECGWRRQFLVDWANIVCVAILSLKPIPFPLKAQISSSYLQLTKINEFRTKKIGIPNKPKHLKEVYTGGTGKYSQLVCSVLYEAAEIGEGQIMTANSEEGDEGGRVRHEQDDGSEI